MCKAIQLIAIVSVIPGYALAQQPVIEELHNIYDANNPVPHFDATTSAFTTIPQTTKTVTIPAGKAVIHWTMYGFVQFGVVRAVIGNDVTGRSPTYAVNGQFSGTLTADVQGGTVDVSLQLAKEPDWGPPYQVYVLPDIGLSWVLVVYPTQSQGAPAVSEYGLVVMVLVGLVAGTLIFRRRDFRLN